jgi:hypothetical protein
LAKTWGAGVAAARHACALRGLQASKSLSLQVSWHLLRQAATVAATPAISRLERTSGGASADRGKAFRLAVSEAMAKNTDA